MAYYHRLGDIPRKRHTQFRQPDGSLYHEQLVGTLGFSGVSSLLYHRHAPTRITRIGEPVPYEPVKSDVPLAPYHIRPFKGEATGEDYLSARKTLLMNKDCTISICLPREREMTYFYKNALADEIVFIHEGSGELHSQMGRLEVEAGDYVVIPRTIIHQWKWSEGPVRLLITESFSPVETVRRYRNHFGQLLEHSPYCERDIRPPHELLQEDQPGEYLVQIKKEGFLHQYYYDFSPLDVVGWDGYFYPYAFSIHDFEPITGRIHQPPPVHQTFETQGFVVCSFVPRLFDYHPLAIPAPYNHSNVDSDEILYYVAGNFMSRKGIDIASFTIHPSGLPHGPHPGTVEASIGKKETHELAVMIDTFKPLYLTVEALDLVDQNYPMSWNPDVAPQAPRPADMMD
ncbi:homogentisate 1,2-dioxygenase [Rufibacter glacialis]|uniref:Homogentisate 1,2-dioxygenase n=1 Tax=Rufibacter glacialis TaxID=1259555 RepID=A0A5M8QEM6_9BACT|nr:homogentisate 1,2-dioxygenase [Rufibacter glacialis]KAA6433206.1 homogentisate 1,2-dioxygenase [Rufibacter glacialis]GGK76496.1 homogentisate 1,2-dioxygenase [Rufibacter glacialis]